MDMSRYRELFLSEADEHLRQMGDLIVRLEKEPGDREALDSLFRQAHSMKGMATSMGYGGIADLAHKMESLMVRTREGEVSFDGQAADLLLEGVDVLCTLVRDENAPCDTAGLSDRLAAHGTGTSSYPAPPAPSLPAGDAPAAAEAPPPAPPETQPPTGTGRGFQETVRIRTSLLDRLVTVTGELITTRHRLATLAAELESKPLSEATAELARLLRELHDDVREARMMPFESIADRFPRAVRDLARSLEKQVDLEIRGREIELDRGILEELVDPLMHIVRNCVDHGIEPVAERIIAGKPAAGRLRMTVTREKDHVLITVEDDGRGIDPQRLKETTLRKGLIDADTAERLSPQDLLMLICLPGFSTARAVTEISGRGVGMDAVNTAVRGLGGTLTIDSRPGLGTGMQLKLPRTIAIVNILLASCGPLLVGIPAGMVVRMLELDREALISREGRIGFMLEEEQLPLVSLARLLGVPHGTLPGRFLPTLVVEMRGRRIGLAVDLIHGQQELFIRPLGRPLDRLRGLSGGALLGDGRGVFILDIASIL